MAKIKLKSYIKSIHGRVDDVIYYTVNGRQYMRKFTYPRNPRTVKQQQNRNSFGAASKQWSELTPAQKHRFNSLAGGRPLSGYNLFVSFKMKGGALPGVCSDGAHKLYRTGTESVQSTSVYDTQLHNSVLYCSLYQIYAVHKPPG